jgi:hypothetical protein
MEIKDKEPDKISEKKAESNNKESTNIEPIETIQSSFKGNTRKNFQQNHHKQNHFNNYNNHTYYPNNFANQNTISKNRKGSLKVYSDQRYPNFIKNSDTKNKLYNNNYKKKRIQEMNNNNNDYNSQVNDNKLNFINS